MLPVRALQKEMEESLRRDRRLVLTAPTGSGKSTQVPQMLLESELCPGRILVLQPRRIAARMLARRVAQERDSKLGDEVGYAVRGEGKSSNKTRILFITEGILLRMMQEDPELDGVSAVVLDEFHERSWQTDVAVALCAKLVARREGLHLVVMSATLEVEALKRYLNCPFLSSEARCFPVTVAWRPAAQLNAPIWGLAAAVLEEILKSKREGDVLIFMPGGYEIRRTIEACSAVCDSRDSIILPLHGELTPEQQDAALSPNEKRRIIVATNVAETSLTIDGIIFVIDAGLARESSFDPGRGIGTLLLQPISQASSEQRAGRAGRTAPGHCYRLWSQEEHRRRAFQTTPEVRRMDLAELVLGLKGVGVTKVAEFPWFEPPRPESLEHALEVLTELGILDADEALTPLGREVMRLPMHPRLGRLLCEASRRGCLEAGIEVAALVSERDILLKGREIPRELARRQEGPASDLFLLADLLNEARKAKFSREACDRLGLNSNACRTVEDARRHYAQVCESLGLDFRVRSEPDALLKCLITAFPDHLAVRKDGGSLNVGLSKGRRGVLDSDTCARREKIVLAAEIREVGAGAAVVTKLSSISEVPLALLEELYPQDLKKGLEYRWNQELLRVDQLRCTSLFGLALEERPSGEASGSAASAFLVKKMLDGELTLTQWNEACDNWISRVACLSQWFPEKKMICYSRDDLELLYAEICNGASRWREVKDRPVFDHLVNLLSWEEQQFVRQMAPDKMDLPAAKKAVRITYTLGQQPKATCYIQDLFGLTESPSIAAGRVKLLLEIVAPSRRPLQVTEDLAGFWERLYPQIKPELQRKYPRWKWE
ncbi:MAG: ATP-dependent helicase HrpB [Verrucomicrobiota bacterium]|jgi:ATP-dependent helicase HrpB